jgi:hypothetical protein
MIKTIKKHLSNGNIKIGHDTLIFNLGSAHDCIALKMGICKIGAKKCYAHKTEVFRPHTLPYRRRQLALWDQYSEYQFAEAVEDLVKRRRTTSTKIKFFRLNESGEFRDQADINKFTNLAILLSKQGIRSYTYTTRMDLDLSQLNKAAVVTLSGESDQGFNSFYPVAKFSGKNLECHADCRKCNLCKVWHGNIIEVIEH